MKLLVSTRGPCWAVAGQDRHFASQPHGVELNHPCGLTVDGTSPSASMCPSPSRVRLRQRTASSRSEDAPIRGGHPGTRCMTRLTVAGHLGNFIKCCKAPLECRGLKFNQSLSTILETKRRATKCRKAAISWNNTSKADGPLARHKEKQQEYTRSSREAERKRRQQRGSGRQSRLRDEFSARVSLAHALIITLSTSPGSHNGL
ncbi:hypothetical protein WN48_06122 [Eufriesea mexicana]|nr:hypothetical protein WN48_06122 [Eufriesea mexicana]